MTPILQLNQVLHLGLVDAGSFNTFKDQEEAYFKKFHFAFWRIKNRSKFRGEGLNEWVAAKKIPGNDIKKLQQFLHKHGFMPFPDVEGVFGYQTLASVRLFQHYILHVEGIKEVGIPDGRVFKGTHNHMMRWEENDLYASWGPDKDKDTPTWSKSTKEYDLWMELLPKVKNHYLNLLKNTPEDSDDLALFQLKELNSFDKETDSKKVAEWSFDRKDIHLLGLRCQPDISSVQRGNDDLFVLLINGMVFKFWGSTDPNPSPKITKRKFEPYLIEGQHKYRLAWHKVSSSAKVYQALRPYQPGVLVFRDWNGNNALSESDIRKGLKFNANPNDAMQNNPNTTINIHWTADGKTNWSAGCQVISGRSYMNEKGDIIDCSSYSASTYSRLSFVSKRGVKQNKGAYTFASDFMLTYASKDYLNYTLGRESAIQEFATPDLVGALANAKIMGSLNTNEAVISDLIGLLKDPKKVDGMA